MNQFPKTRMPVIDLTSTGGLFFTSQLEFRPSNKRYSTDCNGVKQAGLNMPEIRLNFNVATRHQSALSVVH